MEIFQNKWVLYGGAAIAGLALFMYFRSSGDDSSAGGYMAPILYAGAGGNSYGDGTSSGVATGSSGMSAYDEAYLKLQEKQVDANIMNNQALLQIQQQLATSSMLTAQGQIANEQLSLNIQKELGLATNETNKLAIQQQGKAAEYQYNLGLAQNEAQKIVALTEIDANKTVALAGFQSQEAIAAMSMVQEIAGSKGGAQIIGKGGQISIGTPYGNYGVGSTGTPNKQAKQIVSGSSAAANANQQILKSVGGGFTLPINKVA